MAHNILLHRRANAIWHLRAEADLTDQVLTCGEDILRSRKMQSEQHFMQHGMTDCFTHSICVAYMALRVARFFSARVDIPSLVRGCLLHDYFLYDWHKGKHPDFGHAFGHPGRALRNALRDYKLTEREVQIIRHHMWPLTVIPPTCREAWLVIAADKICTFLEVIRKERVRL